MTAEGQFFLRNAGFFDELVAYGATFTRVPGAKKPIIDVERLPRE